MKTIPAYTRYFHRLVSAKAATRHDLSTIVSQLRDIDRTFTLNQEEIDMMHAPSECHDLMWRTTEAEVREFARSHGFGTVRIMVAVITSRTSPKWVYFNLGVVNQMK